MDRLASKVAESLENGGVLGLIGNLGTGKTTFTKRICKYFGITENVKSPTFTYVIEYTSGIRPVYHFDVYRIGDIEEMDAVLGQFVAYARDGRDEHAEPLDLADLCRNAATAVPGDWTLDLPDSAPMRGRPWREVMVGMGERVGDAVIAAQMYCFAWHGGVLF